jgi:hypothetical protein
MARSMDFHPDLGPEVIAHVAEDTRNGTADQFGVRQLAADDTGLLAGLTEQAASRGCVRLWVHSTADLSSAGFEPRQGYRRFTAASIEPGDRLPLLDTAAVLELLPRAFLGQWGHHQFDAGWAASAEARYVGLGAPGQWAGLCRFEPERRHIDGPGFVTGAGDVAQAQRLVAGAAAHLGPGPVTLETWGDPAGAYLQLGFNIAEECGGWGRAISPARR